MEMKRGHIILIAGAALLIAGVAVSAVWGMSFAGMFLNENTIVARTTLDAGKSVSAETDVTQVDRPISLAVGIDRQGQPAAPADVRLKETVTDPAGNVVSSNEFADSFFTSFNPKTTGTHMVTITNQGTKPVTISGTFGHVPFMGTGGKPDVGAMTGAQGLGMIILGGGLAAAGVLTLIAGGIITAIDSRSMPSSTTTEGGVTYRKD